MNIIDSDETLHDETPGPDHCSTCLCYELDIKDLSLVLVYY